jgi:hypothetical protein
MMPIESIHHVNVHAPAEELRRLRDCYCRCTDLEGTLARLRENGVQHRVVYVPVVKQTQVFLEDPSGIRVELNFVQ